MAIIRQLSQSIGTEQMPALATALSPEQLMRLMELHRIVGDESGRKNEEEAAQRKVVPTSAEDLRRERAVVEQEASRQAAEASVMREREDFLEDLGRTARESEAWSHATPETVVVVVEPVVVEPVVEPVVVEPEVVVVVEPSPVAPPVKKRVVARKK